MNDSRRATTIALALTLATWLLPSSPVLAEAMDSVTVLKGGRIIDGGGGTPIEKGTIVIRNGVIEAIVADGAPLPAKAQIIDVSGKTLMPALIAAHSHLGLTDGATARAQNITEQNVERQLKKYMRYGVGDVASFGTDHDFIYKMRARQLEGRLLTPAIITAGHGFGVPDGAPPQALGMDQVYRPASVADVKRDMADLVKQKPDLVKVWVDDFGDKSTKKMDPALYKEIIKQAHLHGLKVAAHVYYLEDAKRLARDGVDIFGHSVRDKKVDGELIALMKKNKVAYIPTLNLDEAFFIYADHPDWMQQEFFKQALDPGVWDWLHGPEYTVKQKSRQDLAIAKANVLALHKAGIAVGLGTDSGATIPRIQGFAEHRELELLTSAGLSAMDAIQAATAVNAAILGLDASRGTLAPGKQADILVLNANPLDDIKNTRQIESLWLRGVCVHRTH